MIDDTKIRFPIRLDYRYKASGFKDFTTIHSLDDLRRYTRNLQSYTEFMVTEFNRDGSFPVHVIFKANYQPEEK